MNPQVYHLSYGSPEKHVPSAYAPSPLVPVKELESSQVKEILFSVSKRGSKLVLPLTENTKIYGFGLQLREFNHRGNKITVRVNADPVSKSGDSHAPVPFFVTNEGWGMYVDTARNVVFQCGGNLKQAYNSSQERSSVMTSTKELYAAQTSDSSVMTIEVPIAQGIDVYFFTGKTILDIVCAYNLFSGGGCMPPMWGLGNIYRCRSTFNQEEVLDMARRFREMQIPCDILGLEPGWQTRFYPCSFVWSERFPEHRQMLEALKNMGYHVNLWEHIFTHSDSPIYEKLIPYSADYLVWKGLVPDLSLNEASEIYADHHRKLCDEGISAFKIDECDGSDFTGGWSYPDFAMFPSGMDGEQYHHLVGALASRTMEKVLGKNGTLSQIRSMGALAASYPFVLYSDLYEFKDFLTGTVNSGFAGLLWSPEVREAQDKEELIRRLQLVTFSVQSLVNAWYLDDMPWIPLEAVEEARKILSHRMSFLPYLYTAFYDYHTTGKPPVRALVCDYPEAEDIYNQYLYGDLIVAPLAPHETERQVWLPEGEWYDVFTCQKFTGGMHSRSTQGIPVYVRAGTILPLAEPVNSIIEGQRIVVRMVPFGECTESVGRVAEQISDGNYVIHKLRLDEKRTTNGYIIG